MVGFLATLFTCSYLNPFWMLRGDATIWLPSGLTLAYNFLLLHPLHRNLPSNVPTQVPLEETQAQAAANAGVAVKVMMTTKKITQVGRIEEIATTTMMMKARMMTSITEVTSTFCL